MGSLSKFFAENIDLLVDAFDLDGDGNLVEKKRSRVVEAEKRVHDLFVKEMRGILREFLPRGATEDELHGYRKPPGFGFNPSDISNPAIIQNPTQAQGAPQQDVPNATGVTQQTRRAQASANPNAQGGQTQGGPAQPIQATPGNGSFALAKYAIGNARVGMPSSIEGVHPEFANRIDRMVQAMPPEIAQKFNIISGHRSAERQAQVNPGVTNSHHAPGMAVDTTWDKDVRNWITQNGNQFGVGYTIAHLPNEGNHLEPTENGQRIPPSQMQQWAKTYQPTTSTSSASSSPSSSGDYSNVKPGTNEYNQVIGGIIRQESGGRQGAVSKAGASGLMGLMPGTARGLGVNPNDAQSNVQGGTAYFNQMLSKYGNTQDALRAYNWGPGNMDKWISSGRQGPMPKEAENYPGLVLGHAQSGAGDEMYNRFVAPSQSGNGSTAQASNSQTPNPRTSNPQQSGGNSNYLPIGDSLAYGVGGTMGNTRYAVSGSNPEKVMGLVNQAVKDGGVQGKHVILSGGASNAGGDVNSVNTYYPQMIQALKNGGASNVTVMGVGPYQNYSKYGYHDAINKIANDNGVNYTGPLADIAPFKGTSVQQQVHPTDYRPILAHIQNSSSGTPNTQVAQSTPTPSTTSPQTAQAVPPPAAPKVVPPQQTASVLPSPPPSTPSSDNTSGVTPSGSPTVLPTPGKLASAEPPPAEKPPQAESRKRVAIQLLRS